MKPSNFTKRSVSGFRAKKNAAKNCTVEKTRLEQSRASAVCQFPARVIIQKITTALTQRS